MLFKCQEDECQVIYDFTPKNGFKRWALKKYHVIIYFKDPHKSEIRALKGKYRDEFNERINHCRDIAQ